MGAAALTSPLDVLKTRFQTQTELGFFELIQSTYKRSGLTGFFRGTLPRICLAIPAAAVSWGTYETIRLGLQRWSESRQMAKSIEDRVAKKPSLHVQRTDDPAPVFINTNSL